MKNILCLLLLTLMSTPLLAATNSYDIYFDKSVPQIQFGVEEIKAEFAKQGIAVSSHPLPRIKTNNKRPHIIVVRAANNVAAPTPKELLQELLKDVSINKTAQSYHVRVNRNRVNKVRMDNGADASVSVIAKDASGAMYGALDLAEAIKLNTFNALTDYEKTPHIAQRGIKFNIPLDMRSPTYSDKNDASQNNIGDMWNMEFWAEMLDEMARNRYNVISLWNLHPFPSVVKVPEFPNVALQNVHRKKSNGLIANNMIDEPDEPNAPYEVLKIMSIDEKIAFWRKVMQYGQERGISFYWYTWNIFTHGAQGQYGITDKQNNEATIRYFRASVRELVLTYPLLAGIGITAGEHMENLTGEYSNENWLWRTYGEGIRDALKIQPKRKFRLTHRFHLSSQSEILNAWRDYPSDFDFSFKYLYAHMYSDTQSVFIKPALEQLAPNLKMWLELRNDDIYSFRWGDPDFAREFIKNLPPDNKFAGFNMGPDGYMWGREYLSKQPESPRQLVMKKQWYSFMLWGRLSFDPALPNAHFKNTLAAHFPSSDAELLFQASNAASKIFPEITRFFWGDIDIRWFPEACIKAGVFYTVKDFILQVTMPGTDNINIMLWRDKKIAGEPIIGKTPLAVAASLQEYAQTTLRLVAELRNNSNNNSNNNKELTLLLGDYEAFAHLGNYYAEKILGASAIAMFDATKKETDRTDAIRHLESALNHWTQYGTIYTQQYVQPVKYGRAGLVDIPGALRDAVAADITLAKQWQPGSIKGPLVGRKELNFKP